MPKYFYKTTRFDKDCRQIDGRKKGFDTSAFYNYEDVVDMETGEIIDYYIFKKKCNEEIKREKI